MKTYPFILVDKSNMTKLEHFATADQVVVRVFPSTKFERFVIIKDEKRVVPLESMTGVGGDVMA